MRIALAAARFVNGDIVHNLAQIDRFAAQAREQGAALVCFGEAFLQGFDCLGWTYAQDRSMAVPAAGDAMAQVRRISEKQGVDILLGFLERDGERSPCTGVPAHIPRLAGSRPNGRPLPGRYGT